MATSKYINMIKEFDENLSGLEDIFGDISSAVDFYNAVVEYNKTGNEDQFGKSLAVLDIFSTGFDIAKGKIPSIFGGYAIDTGAELMEKIENISVEKYKKQLEIEAIEIAATGNTHIAQNYVDNHMAIYYALKEIKENVW